MSMRDRFSCLLAAILLLVFASPAFANALAPTAYFWPGVLPFMLGLALPASVLAAVLERPFISKAGIQGRALCFSLQANLISLIIGYITIPVGGHFIYSIGPIWSLIAVAVSVLSEGWYYQWRAVRGPIKMRWGWIVGGNVFSSVVILLLPSAAMAIKEAKPHFVWLLDPYQGYLFWGSVGASVVAFVASFLAPALLVTRTEGSPNFQIIMGIVGLIVAVIFFLVFFSTLGQNAKPILSMMQGGGACA